MSDAVRLAIPSKGSLEEPTLRFLADCGLPVLRPNPRQYSGALGGARSVQAVFQRAADIPQKLHLSLVDVGITGYDLYSEHLAEAQEVLLAVEDLGYARCSLVLAIPEAWLDVTAIEDLVEVARDFRAHGRTLRVATKFPRLVRRFLLQHGVASFSLVESSGALEIAPAMGYADLIADINETGTTLRANHLKTIRGGTILESRACLLVNRSRFVGSPERLEVLRGILEMIEAHQRAAGVVSITANVQGTGAAEVAAAVLRRRELAGISGPTVTPVFDPERPGAVFAVTLVLPHRLLAEARDHLRDLGGGAITVYRPLYLFDGSSSLYGRLLERLQSDAGAP